MENFLWVAHIDEVHASEQTAFETDIKLIYSNLNQSWKACNSFLKPEY